jgi:uncharacterized protein involved in response to NO
MSGHKRFSIDRDLLFSLAFRPFFLLVGVYAVVVVLAWALQLAGVWPWPSGVPAHIRHAHEMLFGFAGGAIAGFLLTAVATWTARPPVSGRALMALCAAWGTARLGAWVPGSFGMALWAVGSLAFWAGLMVLMAREVIAARNARNYKVVPILAAFLVADAGFFFATGSGIAAMELWLRAGLMLILGMISLVGGRIIPAFTQNWLRLNSPGSAVQLPPFDRLDLAANLISVVFGAGFVFWPEAGLTGWAGVLAALTNGFRLARWKGWLARREPLLWILHLGYAWIPLGFGLLGLAILGWPALFGSGLHALGYGAIGTLILGVAARVALGHTGRPLRAFPAMTLAFGLLTAGTLARIFVPFIGGLMSLSAVLWVAAYALFLMQYTPILWAPRLDT